MNSSLAFDRPHDLLYTQSQSYQHWQPIDQPAPTRESSTFGIRDPVVSGSKGSNSWAAPFRVGLPTPPLYAKDMTGLSLNPLTTSYGSQPPNTYNSKSFSHSAVPTMNSSDQGYQNNHSSSTGIHYQDQAVSRPQDIPVKPSEPHHSRKAPSNSIASYLQIPSSINDSKGSLAEFAAQITCLFWFESSATLQRIEDVRNGLGHVQPLVQEAVPTMGFRKWVTTILSTTQVSQNVILLALLFIYRLKKYNLTVRGKSGSEYRLLTVALMLGNKFLDDNTYTNKTWAEVSGISVQEIHIMEVEFLSNMRYTLFTSQADWKEWHMKLARFWTYFDWVSRSPPELPRPHGPLTPTHLMPSLPSPPQSTNTSPPFMSSQQTTPNHSWHAPQAIPQYNSQSPYRRLPEVDLLPTQRKRSYDEQIQGPPAKRITRSMTPSAMPPTALAPLHNSIQHPNLPRLPAPNVSQNTYWQQHNNTPNRLPLPGSRAMSTVYNGGPMWQQSNSLPGSAAPTPLNIQTNMLPSFEDHSSHQSPYAVSSVVSSPITSLAAHSQPQNHLSPSFFLTHRNSPYRPVRGVNTLLIPPPSASMHYPRALNLGQMQYQPLGKSTEPRTGIVPYMHHEHWPQLHEPQNWPALPQPSLQG